MTNELGVYISANRIVVSSRDVARVFEKEHFNVLRDIRALECSNEFRALNFEVSSYSKETGNGTYKEYSEYLITRDGFTLLAMGFTGAKAMAFKEKYIAAFNAMEKELISRAQLPDFTDPVIAARAWADEVEQKLALAAKVEADAPKVLFADAVETSKTDILIGDFAKILKQNGIDIGQKRLFARFREDGWLIKQKGESWNMPTQRAMDMGLFRLKERTINNPDGTVRITRTVKITGKGQIYFLNKFLKEMKGE